MRISTFSSLQCCLLLLFFLSCFLAPVQAQTTAFPGAEGFGRFAQGARASATKEVYVVTNLNDSGAGSFRDAVSKSGRIVVFSVGGIIRLVTDISVAANITIAGQTAPGDGVVISNKRVTFTNSNNTICRFLRLRLGATGNSGKDVSGLASGANMIFDHMSFTWAMDEVFSINWDGKGTSPDNITIQNSIIGQGLHRENHSAGGLIQTPDGGKVSLLKNLYISNKTRNPKVKGVNEFVNNVVYNWGNGNRLGDNLNYGWSGEGYIMGGSSGVSEVNVINNYFVSGPLTPPSEQSPFSRGTGSFNIYGSGNYFDHNKNGVLDGTVIPYDGSPTGYPGITAEAFKTSPYPYPAANPTLTAEQAYQHVIDNVGATYPHRDDLDAFLVDEVKSKGVKGFYVYRETDLPLANGGLGNVFGAAAPQDSDNDGMPDAWEDANGLNKNNAQDAVAMSTSQTGYLNIEVYINGLALNPPTTFLRPPSNLTASNITPSSINLSWTDNSDSESNFILERSVNGTVFTIIDTLNANVTNFGDTGLDANKMYYYRIKGITVSESSAYASLTAKTATLPSAPAIPSLPSPASGSTGIELANRNLTWTGSSNTISYKVYFGTDSSSLEYKSDVTSASYPVTGLLENTTYFWRIDAVNSLGTTTGDVWSFKTLKNFPLGIIGDWRFDETFGTVAADSSIYRNDAEINDVPDYEWIAGKINNGINLETMTSASGVLVPHQEHLLLDKNSFSFSLWVKGAAQSNVSKYLFHKGTFIKDLNNGATGKWFGIELKDGNLIFSVDDDVTKSSATTSSSTFFNNVWNHIVVVRDVAAKKLRVYKNGALMVETTDNTLGGIGGDEPLVIANTNSFNAPFAGMMDEMKAFNYVLSENDILRLYHTSPLPLQAFSPNPVNNAVTATISPINASWKGGINTSIYKVFFGTASNNLSYKGDVSVEAPVYQFNGLNPNTVYFWRVDAVGSAGTTEGAVWSFKTPFQQGIVADWKLDATSGTAITDNTPYQTHGTLQNITDYAWEAGRINNGLNLKTVTAASAIRVPHKDNIHFDKTSFSISLWVKAGQPASASTSSYMLHKGTFTKNTATGATGRWFGVELKSGNISWNVDDDVVKSSVTMSSSTFLNNTWVNIVFVRDVVAKKLRIYRNGTLAIEATDNTTLTNGIGGIEPLTIANSNDLNSPFKGMLDEIKMFNYTLSASEISGLAAAKDAQTITFSGLPDKQLTDADFDAGATTTSGLAITYSSSDNGVATIADGKIHLVGTGSATITATQGGNASYIAAVPVSQVLTVVKGSQIISFNSLPQKILGEPDFSISASASSGLPVSFSSSNASVATVINGTVHITGVGSSVITATQEGNAIYSSATNVEQVFVVLPDTIAPTMPADLSAITTDSTVTLSWTASSDFIGVTGYTIYKNGQAVGTSSGTTFRVEGLSSSLTYSFAVAANDNAGNESERTGISVTTPDTQAPGAVTLLADKTNKHTVALSWAASTDNVAVIGYNVYRNGVKLNNTLLATTNYLAERPIGYNVYEFTVKAVDVAGNLSPVSNTERIQNGQAGDKAQAVIAASFTGIDLSQSTESLSIYPNPSNGEFKINVNSNQNGKIAIAVYNTAGVIVKSFSDLKDGDYSKEVKLSGLSAGTYILRMSLNGFVQSKSIIIN
ncbi:LamG-like jellyroll fold domain-containing protein [Pedobacter sp. P351]|uniref:LamG-like jellyroll fold domain-containing protein n=1 Tax=Pedobacter superstes TaxID=3133441 RepID=UPI0030A66CA1